VVEVVVSLADGDQSGDEVVTGSVLVVESVLSEPMSQRVDTESGVVDEQQPSGTGKEETSLPIAPTETGNTHGEEQSHDQQERQVVVVLPPDDLASGQVGNVGDTDLGPRLEDHPADVCPPEPFVGRVRVEAGVGVTVVGSVATGPPLDGSLDSSSSSAGEDVLERARSGVRSVGPQSVVSGGDSEPSDKVVQHRPDGGVRVPLDVEYTVNGQGGSDGQGQEGHPLDVLVPVGHRDRRQTLLGLDRPGDIVVRDVEI